MCCVCVCACFFVLLFLSHAAAARRIYPPALLKQIAPDRLPRLLARPVRLASVVSWSFPAWRRDAVSHRVCVLPGEPWSFFLSGAEQLCTWVGGDSAGRCFACRKTCGCVWKGGGEFNCKDKEAGAGVGSFYLVIICGTAVPGSDVTIDRWRGGHMHMPRRFPCIGATRPAAPILTHGSDCRYVCAGERCQTSDTNSRCCMADDSRFA